MRQVRLTAEAADDLERIADYIALDNLQRARTFLQELQAQCLGLAKMPLAWPLVARYAHLGVRRKPYGNYQTFYRVEPAQVVVLHVLHGAMDYADLM